MVPFLERPAASLPMLLTLTAASPSTLLAEEDKLYYFIDENGVTHLSNMRLNPRYKPLVPDKRGKEPGSSSSADGLVPLDQPASPDAQEPDGEPLQPVPEPPAMKQSPVERAR